MFQVFIAIDSQFNTYSCYIYILLEGVFLKPGCLSDKLTQMIAICRLWIEFVFGSKFSRSKNYLIIKAVGQETIEEDCE